MWSVIQVQNQLSSFRSELGWVKKSWTCGINWPVVQTGANNDKDVSINYKSSIYPLTPVQLLARIIEDWKNHGQLAQIIRTVITIDDDIWNEDAKTSYTLYLMKSK